MSMFTDLVAALFMERLARLIQLAGVTPVGQPAREDVFYRTRDGAADYAFSIERQPNRTYRVYIVAQPGYGNRPTEPSLTHRLTDGAGRRFICWSHPIETHIQARTVAAQWADATQRYINRGHRF